MPDVLNPRVVACLRLFGRGRRVVALLLGALVLVGWVAGSRPMVTVLPGLAAMSPATACAFVLAGLSLGARRPSRPAPARGAALLLLALAVVVLAGHLVLHRDVLSPLLGNRMAGGVVGMTAPATAFGFLLLGVTALHLGRVGRRHERIVLACSGSGLLVSGLALLGYAYGVEGLYATAFYRTTALHTATGLFVLFLACLLHDPQRGWAAIIASGLPSGGATRVQLLIATLLPLLGGLLVLHALRAGSLAPSLGIAILVASTMVPLVLRILVDGRMLDELDMRRRGAVAALRHLNEDLERRVRERTRELALSEAQFRSYFDHAPEGLAVFERMADGTFVFDVVNPAFRVIYATGDAPVAGVSPRSFTSEAAAADVQRHLGACLRSGRPHHYTVERAVAGGTRTIDVVLAPVPPSGPGDRRLVVGSMRDVTEAVTRDEQLRQAHKMEAVGQLTGGLAHDFNNILGSLSGNLELLELRLGQERPDEVRRHLEVARGATRRAAVLTHRLLAFSRRQTLDPRPTDLNALVVDMWELIRSTMGPGVAVELVEGEELWATLVDPNQLDNALLNLCLNARDAMPGGGRLSIETANASLGPARAAELGLPAGDYVSLAITDTGGGMTPAVLARAVDPFFTTKPLGEGTGLGLSMVYGFVGQSRGQVHIASAPGQGTRVQLVLPRHAGAASLRGDAAPFVPAGATPGHTVLVVEDEEEVRTLVVEVLEEIGYATLQAGDGAAAVAALRSPARIDLLITDIGLPGGMNGHQVAEAAVSARPGLKVLFITGYDQAAVLGRGELGRDAQVLTKPFTLTALVGRTRDLIARTEPQGSGA